LGKRRSNATGICVKTVAFFNWALNELFVSNATADAVMPNLSAIWVRSDVVCLPAENLKESAEIYSCARSVSVVATVENPIAISLRDTLLSFASALTGKANNWRNKIVMEIIYRTVQI